MEEGQLPFGEPAVGWSFGDVEAGLAEAELVYDESFTTQGNSHHSMEPRTAMAWWENGKCVRSRRLPESHCHPDEPGPAVRRGAGKPRLRQ